MWIPPLLCRCDMACTGILIENVRMWILLVAFGLYVDYLQTARHEIFEYSAQQHERREGEPQGIVPDDGMQGVEYCEVRDRGYEHRVAHDARLGGTDHDAVHDEGHGGNQGYGYDPADVAAGVVDDELCVGCFVVDEQMEQILPPSDIYTYVEYGYDHAPCHAAPYAGRGRR